MPVRFLNLVASQEVQAEALVHVKHVDEHELQFTAPESKNPLMHLQFVVISLRVESTQAEHPPLGEVQF